MRARGSRRWWRWVTPAVAVLLVPAVVALISVVHHGGPWSAGPGDHDRAHRATDGTRQQYRVHLPPQHDGRTRLPVVMAIHGCGMTGFGWNSMEQTTQFDALADREGFIVVYPTQRPFESLLNCWNSADPRNQQRGAGEPARLAGVAREVVGTYGADPARVHVAGASSGAGTAVILAATYPDVFATATSVAGGEFGLDQVDADDPDATPVSATARQAWAQMADRARHVPLLVVQGGQDDVVPPLVGERLVEHWLHVNDLVDDGLLNGSLGLTRSTTSVPAARGRHGYERTVHASAAGRVLVEHHLVPEMGHAWPGPAGEGLFTDQAGPDAAELTWRFAQRHDLGRPSR